jgi:hypothetical protein
MEKKDENEKLIGKLIKKRKAENDAFIKLLNAMEIKQGSSEKSKSTKK